MIVLIFVKYKNLNVFIFTIYNNASFNDVYFKKSTVKYLKEFIFENYYKQKGFIEKDSYYLLGRVKRKYLLLFANNLTKNIPDPTTEHYELFFKHNDKKFPKTLKAIKNPKKGNKKSVTLRQPKTTFNLLKPIVKSNIISEEAEVVVKLIS